MITFVGSEQKGFFVKEVAKVNNQELNFVESNPTILQQINDILANDSDYIIFDIEQYVDAAVDVAEEIKRIQRAKNSTIIILAQGYDRESKIVQELLLRGIIYYIYSPVSGVAKEELDRCLKGYFKEEKIVQKVEDKKVTLKSNKKIGITGACNRIGTTTQAIQLCKYLMLKGYTTCYVQMNATGYVELLEKYFNTVHDTFLGKVTFEGVEMYYKQENISEVLKQEYDFYVYDYGTYSDTDFNKTSFLEKEIQLFVMGSKANEIMQTDEVLRNQYYKDVSFIFNFISRTEKNDVLELMEERAINTYFSVYAPDPFVYVPNEMYEKLLPVEDISEVQEKKTSFYKRVFQKNKKKGA